MRHSQTSSEIKVQQNLDIFQANGPNKENLNMSVSDLIDYSLTKWEIESW